MYSVRVTTPRHGDTYAVMAAVNVAVTAVFAGLWGADVVTVFVASALLVTAIELGLAASGLRTAATRVGGRVLPRWVDAALHGVVDGPGFCVPAFVVADRFVVGDPGGLVAVVGVVVAASLFMGLADARHVAALGPDEAPVISRRAMTAPGAVMLLALLNTVCLAAMLWMPPAQLPHALAYLVAYALMVMAFYLINYVLGVRRVELWDPERQAFTAPAPAFQAAALTYDSAYEMALLISPAYWVPFHLGLFAAPTFA